MPDFLDSAARSKRMAAIKSANTAPELIVRRGLHSLGFRFRLHAFGMPGKPDIVLPKYETVVFVHGCFWHGHNCSIFRLPRTNTDFWSEKIEANKARDRRNQRSLRKLGWQVIVIRECELSTMAKRAASLSKLAFKLRSSLKANQS